MISHLRGTVSGVAPDGAVIEVGGVGLNVQCTPGTLATLRPGEAARVATCLVVREDSLTLYGFTSDDERNVFELVQTATGVGPRLALAMLAVHSPDALRRAVSTGDLNALTLVPGIGKKGAQRIVLELKDRLGSPGDVPMDGSAGAGLPGGARAVPSLPSWREQAQSGLVNLGWRPRRRAGGERGGRRPGHGGRGGAGNGGCRGRAARRHEEAEPPVTRRTDEDELAAREAEALDRARPADPGSADPGPPIGLRRSGPPG